MPSSAATIKMAMSVTMAPRARMEVNASWPGGIQEGDGLAIDLHLIGADVLGDAAGLAGRTEVLRMVSSRRSCRGPRGP